MNAKDAFSDVGVFFSPVIKPGIINDNTGIITGARLIVSLDRFLIGAGVYSQNLLKSESKVPDEKIEAYPFLDFSYFGAETGYIFYNSNNIYLNLMAFGGFAYTTLSTRIRVDINDESYNPAYGDQIFFIAEPSINFNYRVNSYMHFTAGINYRFSFGADYTPNNLQINYDDQTFSGPGINLMLKFGIF
jgi:hypothetical protein